MKEKILVVDDEPKIIRVIKAYLEKEGYKVISAENGREALDKYKEHEVGLIILDLMLPELSGEEVCRYIRQTSNIPILMLTAKDTEESKITGLNIGADDYVVKPFSPRELIARVKAILRRSSNDKPPAEILSYNKGELKIYPDEMRVEKRGNHVELTSTEFKILLTLALNSGLVLSREQLAEKVMGLEYKGFDRTIDAHIKNIRKKLQLQRNQYIHTVYGAGYKFMVK